MTAAGLLRRCRRAKGFRHTGRQTTRIAWQVVSRQLDSKQDAKSLPGVPIADVVLRYKTCFATKCRLSKRSSDARHGREVAGVGIRRRVTRIVDWLGGVFGRRRSAQLPASPKRTGWCGHEFHDFSGIRVCAPSRTSALNNGHGIPGIPATAVGAALAAAPGCVRRDSAPRTLSAEDMKVAMRRWRMIDGRLSHPYSKGAVRRPEHLRSRPRQPFEEDPPSERTITQPKTIRLLSPPSLENCDIFTMEPAFGRLPLGSRRALPFHEPVAGLPGGDSGRLPLFWLHPFTEPNRRIRSPDFRRNDP